MRHTLVQSPASVSNSPPCTLVGAFLSVLTHSYAPWLVIGCLAHLGVHLADVQDSILGLYAVTVSIDRLAFPSLRAPGCTCS